MIEETTTSTALELRVEDPRLALDERALALAGRNAFPLVAQRTGGKDLLGLAFGTAAALLLGGLTFWSMNGAREKSVVTPPAPPPAILEKPIPAPIVAPMPPPAPTLARPVAAIQVPAAPAKSNNAPVMVFDLSGGGAPATASGTPSAPSASGEPGGKQGAGQGMSDTETFASRLGNSSVETVSATRLANPSQTITQGTFIAATLETAIDSDLPGYARAIVSQDVMSFDGTHVLIPRFSRLIGQYKSGLAAGQSRTYVMWTRLIRPDGVSVALASPGTDYAGQSGLSGEVDSHFMERFGSATLLSVVGGLGSLASSGTSVVLSSGGQSAASVAAQRDAQIPPTVHVAQGASIRVFTARDLDFSPVTELAAARP